MDYLEPWPEPVVGVELLDAIEAQFRRYLSMPDGSPEAVSLWVVFSHAIGASRIAPRLSVQSPVRQCGKTTLLGLLTRLCRHPVAASNISAASVYGVIEAEHPTLILDEADTYFQRGGALVGILNSGHARDTAYVFRQVGGVTVKYETYAAIAIAAIGRLAAPIEDRSVIVRMQRKRRGETLEVWSEADTADLTVLARKASRWVDDNTAALQTARPAMPEGISGRAADNCRILLAIADTAGGEWPVRARRAVQLLCGSIDDPSAAETLIGDIHDIFATHGDRITSADLCRKLAALEYRPWEHLTQHKLSRMLAPFQIRPRVIRFGSRTPHGYERAQFEDAAERYTTGSATSQQPARKAASRRSSPQHKPPAWSVDGAGRVTVHPDDDAIRLAQMYEKVAQKQHVETRRAKRSAAPTVASPPT